MGYEHSRENVSIGKIHRSLEGGGGKEQESHQDWRQRYKSRTTGDVQAMPAIIVGYWEPYNGMTKVLQWPDKWQPRAESLGFSHVGRNQPVQV